MEKGEAHPEKPDARAVAGLPAPARRKKSFLPSVQYMENMFDKANHFYLMKNYEKALSLYNKVLRIKPTFDRAWYMGGNALLKLGRHPEAAEAYKESIAQNPKSSKAWFALGVAFGGMKNYRQEIECYEQALRLEPTMIEAMINKGAALHRLGRYDDAIGCYDIALVIKPDSREALRNRALAEKKSAAGAASGRAPKKKRA